MTPYHDFLHGAMHFEKSTQFWPTLQGSNSAAMDDQRFNFIKQSSAQSAQIFARLLDWLIEEPHGGMAPLVLAWYVALCAVAVLNPVLLARAHRRSPIDRADR